MSIDTSTEAESEMTRLQPELVHRLFDDAAVFPPGAASLPAAIKAHTRYRTSWFAWTVGPFVLPVTSIEQYRASGAALPLAVTLPSGPKPLAALLDAVDLDLLAVELCPPAEGGLREMMAALDAACAGRDLTVSVELPRDNRQSSVLSCLAGTSYRAKLRTGGAGAESAPDDAELAHTLHAVVSSGVPFKATAGLHHAVRNTDPATGFEQHGFLNLLLATDAALGGAQPEDLVHILCDRDGPALAAALARWDADQSVRVRRTFTSFGTCSIHKPLADLEVLGLLRENT